METAFDLVVQGDAFDANTLAAIREATHSAPPEPITGLAHAAYRFADAHPVDEDDIAAFNLDDWSELYMFDFAWVPAGRRLADFRLLAMDMDSTLITIECIDEIADFIGKKAEVAAITARAMQGGIDWAQSLRERVALLAGLDEQVLGRVYDERLRLTRGADALIAAARRAGLITLLVSGGFTFFTERLKARLHLDYAASNTLEIRDGKLTGRVTGPLCDAAAKAHHVRETAKFMGFSRDQIMVIGDGANDLKMMAEAGTSIAFDAKPIVREQATHALSYVGLDGVLALFPAN
jgi:phosphoserine phosphatase